MRLDSEVYLDSAYAIALAAPADQLHERAVSLAQQVRDDGTHIGASQAILLEIGNALGERRFRAAAVRLLSSLGSDPAIEVVAMLTDLYDDAFRLFKSRPDKDWGLIDCVSFVVMESRGIGSSLTSDVHFEQAGFRALLR